MRILTFVFLLLISSSVAFAQKADAKETPRAFAARVAKAFEKKQLGSLDAGTRTKVRVTIEHSLGEGADASKTRSFTSLKSAQSWIRKETGPESRFESGRLKRCGTSNCDFTRNGMLHNHLYLVGFSYGTSKGKYYVKRLWMLDGD